MADISSDKIRQLLSDPKNIELIAGLAGSMNGGLLGALAGSTAGKNADSSGNHNENNDIKEVSEFTDNSEKMASSSEENAVPVSSFDGDVPSFPSFQGFPSGIGSDKRIALLKAIKPYISDSKKERVDGLVRAISVAGILNNYKGGLFGN